MEEEVEERLAKFYKKALVMDEEIMPPEDQELDAGNIFLTFEGNEDTLKFSI